MKISVITVVYNDADGLERTVNSVRAQCKMSSNFEYILIDGASTDNTLDVIKDNEELFDVIVSESDFGIYDAMNKGLGYANGEFVIFMNAGDVFHNDGVILRLINLIQTNKDVDFIYSDTVFDTGELFSCEIDELRIIHQSLCYRKSVHDFVGKYMVAKGVSISDYLFFSLSKNYKWLKTDVISTFEVGGVSSNASHYYQKLLVDFCYNDMKMIEFLFLIGFKYIKEKCRKWFY